MTGFSNYKNEFLLDPEVIFLNHGSFGATPSPVFDSYQRWQRELESQPVEFLGRMADDLLYQSRAELATFLHANPLDLVFVPNATHGINIVARSLDLRPGDIVLTSDHEYGAMDRTWRFLATEKGFTYQAVPVSLPFPSPDELVSLFESHLSTKVKVLYLSHITSPTAVIFPIRELCEMAHQYGILSVVDGAHAPGQIPLDLETLGADFYTGNLHKWLCAPKGSAFLYASKNRQSLLKPLIVSWGYESETPSGSPYIDLFQWAGTRDISPFLAVPDAIRYREERNWPALIDTLHARAVTAEMELCDLTGMPSIYTSSDQFQQMFAVRLPDRVDYLRFKADLYNRFKVEVPTIQWNGMNFLRVSLQAYNSDEELFALYEAIMILLEESDE